MVLPAQPETPISIDLADELHDIAISLARKAGELIVRGRSEALTNFDTKSNPTDVVTQMDRACEQFLREQLAITRPGDGVYGEEHPDRVSESGVRWIVDPIDGTVNYLYGLPDFSVSIGVEVDGVVVAGVVEKPSTGETFHAIKGKGAFLGDEQLVGSNPTGLDVTLVATGFGYDPVRRGYQGELVGGLLQSVRDIRRLGSCALDLCNAAAGRVDAYYEWGLHEWDFAAGALIAAEAGLDVRIPADEEGLFVAAAPSIADPLNHRINELVRPEWNVPR